MAKKKCITFYFSTFQKLCFLTFTWIKELNPALLLWPQQFFTQVSILLYWSTECEYFLPPLQRWSLGYNVALQVKQSEKQQDVSVQRHSLTGEPHQILIFQWRSKEKHPQSPQPPQLLFYWLTDSPNTHLVYDRQRSTLQSTLKNTVIIIIIIFMYWDTVSDHHNQVSI